MTPTPRVHPVEVARGGVTVVGSLNVDLVVGVDVLPDEGATVAARWRSTGTGGKGLNQAVAAARMGAAVRMVGAVGDDDGGATLRDALDADGVERNAVSVVAGPSGTAVVTVAADGANTIVVVAGANAAVSPTAVRAALQATVAVGSTAARPTPCGPTPPGTARTVVLVQQEIPPEVVRTALATGREQGAFTILNPAPATGPLPEGLAALVDIVVPNETEARALTGAPTPEAAAEALRDAGCSTAIVTLGAQGAVVADGAGTRRLPAVAVSAVDSTAAGDAFCGALAAALAAGATVGDAALRAAAAGAAAATTRGATASLPTAAAVDALLARHRA